MPAVSIIIPVYNSASYLHACFASIQMQTLRDFEVILVDDGSTDASQEICRDQCRRDSRFQLFCLEKNSGPGPARNKGLDQAQGRYVIFCDADDAYPEYALQVLHEGITASGVPVCGGNIMFMDNTMSRIRGAGDLVACTQFTAGDVVNPWEYPPLWLPVYHPRYLIATGFLLEHDIRYPTLLRGQDPPFLAHVLCHAEIVAVRPEVVYFCRQTASQKHKVSRQDVFGEYVQHLHMTYDVYMEHGANKHACFFLAQAMANLFSLRQWLTLSGEQRARWLEALAPLVEKAGDQLFEFDYSPYPTDTELLKKDIALINKGQFRFTLAKVLRRVPRFIRR